MNRFRWSMPTVLALAFAMVSPLPAGAALEIDEATYGRINQGLVEQYLVPRYETLAQASGRLKEAAEGFCAGEHPIEPLHSAYDEAMDAWMAVQHIGFGPAELFMRSYRIQFWPQARGKFESAVAELLATGEPSALTPEALRNASVAAQGLPAIEVLLYAPDADFPGDRGHGVSRCDVLVATSANVAEMTAGLLTDWTGGERPFTGILGNPGPDNPYFETAEDATLVLFKSLYAGLELILTAKLRPVLGNSAEAARPELAESPLSGRSARNIVLNLRSLEEMYDGGGTGFAEAVRDRADTELDELLSKAFRMTRETAESVKDPMTDSVRSPQERPKLEKLAVQVQALKQIVQTRLADALGLGVGFNALDGD